MPLPARQVAILRYLDDQKTATMRNLTRDLGMRRADVREALRGLADLGLAATDHGTLPVSYVITDMGSAVVAAANFQREAGT